MKKHVTGQATVQFHFADLHAPYGEDRVMAQATVYYWPSLKALPEQQVVKEARQLRTESWRCSIGASFLLP